MRVFGVFLSLNGLLFILCEREKFYYFLLYPELPSPSTAGRDYYLTTIIRNPQKAGLSSAFNGFQEIQQNRIFSLKNVQPLKTQHFISYCLKTPTVDVYSVVLL